MKPRSILVCAAALTAAFGFGALAQSQATTQRYPQFENEHVRVWKTVIMPGKPLTMHRHEHPRTIVALVGGPLKVVSDKGATEVMNWESGKAYWLTADPPGELHMDVNDTEKPIEVMVVEMRSP